MENKKYDPVSPKPVDKVIKLYFCVVIDEAVSDDARLCSFAQTEFRTHYPTMETGDKSQKIDVSLIFFFHRRKKGNNLWQNGWSDSGNGSGTCPNTYRLPSAQVLTRSQMDSGWSQQVKDSQSSGQIRTDEG